MTFNQWVIDKKAKQADLVFTQALKTPAEKDQFSLLADLTSSLNPSFSSGLQVLEWIADLVLSGHDFSTLTNTQFTDFESFKTTVRQRRFPMTTSREAEQTEWFKTLSWPTGSKPKFERRGDRFGAEIKFFISNEMDLTKAIAGLERLKDEYDKKESTSR